MGDETNGIGVEMFERFYDGNGYMGNESMFDHSTCCSEGIL